MCLYDIKSMCLVLIFNDMYTVNILLSLNPGNSNIILCCKVCSEASREYSPRRNLSQLRSIFLTDDTHDNKDNSDDGLKFDLTLKTSNTVSYHSYSTQHTCLLFVGFCNQLPALPLNIILYNIKSILVGKL